MKTYNITLSDNSIIQMVITDPNTTIENEIAKWGNPISIPTPIGEQPKLNLSVTNYTQV